MCPWIMARTVATVWAMPIFIWLDYLQRLEEESISDWVYWALPEYRDHGKSE